MARRQLLQYLQGQTKFYSANLRYGDLNDLLKAQVISSGLAKQLGAGGRTKALNGYEGGASVSEDGRQFAAELHPTNPGRSGVNYLATDSTGTLYEAFSSFSLTNGRLMKPDSSKSIQ